MVDDQLVDLSLDTSHRLHNFVVDMDFESDEVKYRTVMPSDIHKTAGIRMMDTREDEGNQGATPEPESEPESVIKKSLEDHH